MNKKEYKKERKKIDNMAILLYFLGFCSKKELKMILKLGK